MTMQNAQGTTPPRRGVFGRALAGCAALLALIAGCGGGVGSGGTGTYAAGPITGFGSVIVNDVRFDDSSAAVQDDDDVLRTRTDLKLGMTVVVDGDTLRSDGNGRASTARSIRYSSEIVGPVAAIDVGAGTLTVLGQTVLVAVETIFDERLAGGLAGIVRGQVLEVYALYDAATGRYRATRIEPRTALLWRLRGPVTALDVPARTLVIGSADFAYGNATGVPAELAVGRVVNLRLSTVLDGSGRYVVTRFGTALRTPEDRDDAELRGLVTALVSSTSFHVNGLPVDARSASFPDGTAGLRIGARVEVRGATMGGVLRATRVDISDDDEVRDRGFELKGSITAVDTVSRTFVLRGVTVGWTRSDLRLEGGALADLAVGRTVEVRGLLSADRTRLDATRIKFE